MIRKFIVGLFIFLATIFLASETSFAQGNICLLGVGNCQPGGRNNTNVEQPGRKYLDGALAQQVLQARNYGARYLLRMSSTYDPNTRCHIEIRAWVSGIEGQTNDGRLRITHGPTRTVYLCPGGTTPTVEQINQTEIYIEHSRKWIAELQTNPARYPNSQAWINHYTNYITQANNYVAHGAP